MRKAVVIGMLTAVMLAVMFAFSNQNAETSLTLSDHVAYMIAPIVNADFLEMDAAGQRAVIDALTYPIRKTAHMCEYALLGALVLALVRNVPPSKRTGMGSAACTALALCITVLCAGADELHQYFVDGRSAELADVCIDTAGAALGMAIEWAAVKACRRGRS